MISVVICTHNPRVHYLSATLDGLRDQSLSFDAWEVLVIDNRSDTAVSGLLDLSWHPNAKVIIENELGLTPARLRGIRESIGELIVFVDDDNVLDPDYLKNSAELAVLNPSLGIFGAANIIPEYEKPLAYKHLNGLTQFLALRERNSDKWGTDLEDGESTPFGAGLVIRRHLARSWADSLEQAGGNRRGLGRRGTSLGSAEDVDMAWHCVIEGFAKGTFARLRMVHLIPAFRTLPKYFARLIRGVGYSNAILREIYGLPMNIQRPSTVTYLVYSIFRNPIATRYVLASWVAARTAKKDILAMRKKGAERVSRTPRTPAS